MNYLGERGWDNYDNFAGRFVQLIINSLDDKVFDLSNIASELPGAFFRLNGVSRSSFLSTDLFRKLQDLAEDYRQKNKLSPTTIATIIQNLNSIQLAQYSVVGAYVRYEQVTRSVLKDFKRKVFAPFEGSTKAHENFLIWGEPGTGKTFLVKQLAAKLRQQIHFDETNLAESVRKDFSSFLSRVAQHSKETLCFIDEIDSRPTESWPFASLLPILDRKVIAGQAMVFILAGSLGNSLSEMKRRLEGSPKGKDLLSRIPHGNELEVPPLTAGDRVLLVVASLRQAGKEIGREVNEIEKMAIYFAASNPMLENPRKMREFAIRTVERMPPAEDRVKYDTMFEAGEVANKEFWIKTEHERSELVANFITIVD